MSSHNYRLDALDTALEALDLDLLLRRVRRSEELSEPINQLAFPRHVFFKRGTHCLCSRNNRSCHTPCCSCHLFYLSSASFPIAVLSPLEKRTRQLSVPSHWFSFRPNSVDQVACQTTFCLPLRYHYHDDDGSRTPPQLQCVSFCETRDQRYRGGRR